MNLKFTKDFLNNLENILKANNSLWVKIETIISDFERNWLKIKNFEKYDLKKLNISFYRLKIIPYRIILKKEWNFLIFDNIFKRKWKSDYKKYQKI